MANINDEFKKILKNLENQINDKEVLEKVKTEMFNLYNAFLDETAKLHEAANERITELVEIQGEMLLKLANLETGIKSIEKDIYMDEEDDEEFDLTITCPYCNKEIILTEEDLKDEITCPECNNLIELDWGHGCMDDDCGECSHHCNHDEDK